MVSVKLFSSEKQSRMAQTEANYLWRRRAHRRFELQFPVRIGFESDGVRLEVDGVSKNVSIGGLLVRSVTAIPQYTSVSFVVSLHGRDAVRPVHVMGEGEVVRAWKHEGAYLMAVRCSEPVVHLEELCGFVTKGMD